MTSVRVLAARVLVAVESRRATLGAEVDRARRGLTDERDRALLLELTSGVYRWRAALDACLEPCSQRPLETIDPPLLATLRLAMYQFRYLDRIPVHAVVHESVETARALGASRAAGFINGLLRTYLRARDTISLPARPPDGATRRQQLAYLSITLSHPKWLVARWLDRYGFDDTERWCLFNNTAPDLAVRARRPGAGTTPLATALREEGIAFTGGLYTSDVIRLPPGTWSAIRPALRSELVVQDEGSVLVALAAGARPHEQVLDLCAAPGGKTVVLWGDMGGRGTLIASDTRWARMQTLRDTLAGGGVPPRLVMLDATTPLPFGDGALDRVFVDAPCSGLGTLRRDPDIKWAVTLESLPSFVTTQRRILAHAAAAVRPGGTLVYATCSSEPDENDGVVDRFLTDTPSFTAAPVEDVPDGLIDDRGRLRTTPARHGLDAFFAARLVRRERT